MIVATFSFSKYNKKKIYNKFEITGHAENNDTKNKKLICAGVSSVIFGILNSFNNDFIEIIILKNFIKIIIKDYNYENEIIFGVLFNSLKTIEENNKKNLKIITILMNNEKSKNKI